MQAFHEAKIVIKPLKYGYLATDEVYGCYKRSDNTVGIFLSVSEKQAISGSSQTRVGGGGGASVSG